MAIDDILLYADTPEHTRMASNAARSICEKFNASVTGMFVNTRQKLPVTHHLPRSANKEEGHVSERLSLDAKAEFMRHFDDTPIDTLWIERNGLMGPSLVEEMLYHDFIVMAKRQSSDSDSYGSIINQVILSSSGPVLVTPQPEAHRYIGGVLLVAWNASLQSSRAVRSALPLLRQAASVEIIGAHGPNDSSNASATVMRLSDHLSRLGVSARTSTPTGPGWDDGALLLEHAHTINASMIIMGGWGHSRLREFVLGGTTRNVLNNSPIPVWLHH